jgi:hypothetical protein
MARKFVELTTQKMLEINEAYAESRYVRGK